jgi:hypothetical protein
MTSTPAQAHAEVAQGAPPQRPPWRAALETALPLAAESPSSLRRADDGRPQVSWDKGTKRYPRTAPSLRAYVTLCSALRAAAAAPSIADASAV